MIRETVWSLLGMFLVVVVILALAWAATRYLGALSLPATGMGGPEEFRILAQMAVGRNERLLLVRLGEECCLLGVTEDRITLLRQWTGEEAQRWMRLTRKDPPPDFLSVLKSIREKPDKRGR